MKYFIKFTFIIIFISAAFCNANAASDSLTLTTYYPSPTGHYTKLCAENLGIGTLYPMARLDVNGDVLVRGQIRTMDKLSMMTVILFDQTGVKRYCPFGYALIGQWVSSNGGGPFVTSDSLGNKIPEGMTGLMGLCSSI